MCDFDFFCDVVLFKFSDIVINLGGYTKGAKNEIFAARPCPIQISLMGFAGTLAAGCLRSTIH